MTAAAPVSATLPANPSSGLQNPMVPLEVPGDFVASFASALELGATDAVSFSKEHTPAERWLVPGWALLKMKWPPKGDAEKAELAYLHDVAKRRTQEQTLTARYYSEHGLTDAWEVHLAEYQKGVGPAQAKAAAKLLHDTLNMVNEITQTAKAAASRTRPFVVDPTLPLVVDKPGNSPSYPSGHTSAAVAAAIVLSHLMPHRAKEFMDIAMQASFARIYSGVHFPSDVMSGVRLAATVASYMVGTSLVGPTTPGAAGATRKRGRGHPAKAA